MGGCLEKLKKARSGGGSSLERKNRYAMDDADVDVEMQAQKSHQNESS